MQSVEVFSRGVLMKLKNRIKAICAEKEVKLWIVADHLNMNPTSFSKLVNGRRPPSGLEVFMIARFLELPVEEVFYLE